MTRRDMKANLALARAMKSAGEAARRARDEIVAQVEEEARDAFPDLDRVDVQFYSTAPEIFVAIWHKGLAKVYAWDCND